MASPKSYYCYKCADRVQADMFTFTCTRCGGGFIQEMPEERSSPPPLAESATSFEPRASGTGNSVIPGALAPLQQGIRSANPPVSHSGVQTQPSAVFSPNVNFATPFGPPAGFAVGMRPQAAQQPQGPVQGPFLYMPMGIHPTTEPMQPSLSLHHQSNQQGQVPYGNVRFAYQPLPQHVVNFFPGQVGGSPIPQQGAVPGQMTMGIPVHLGQPQQAPLQPQMNQSQQLLHGHAPQQTDQQNGVLLVGVGGEENGQPMQNVVHLVGGNMQNLMQLLTENIDDVITAILNQMGTQGGPPSITQEEVDRIPTKAVAKEMVDDNRSCSICLESFKIGEQFKDLHCTHQFHGPCIDRWLMIHGNCPICRTHFGEQNQDDQQQIPAFGQAFFDQVMQQQLNQQQEPVRQQMPFVFQQPIGIRAPQIQLAPRSQGFPGPRNVFFQPPAQMQQQQQQAQPFRFVNGRMQFVNPNANVFQNQSQQLQQQPGQNPQRVVWSGQVYMNDPAGPSIVLEMHSPNRPRQAAPQQERGVQRPRVPNIQAPNISSVRANQPAVPPPNAPSSNLIQSVLNSVSQMFTRQPTPQSVPPRFQSSSHQPQPAATNQAQSPPPAAQNPSRNPPSGPAPNTEKPNLQDDLDMD